MGDQTGEEIRLLAMTGARHLLYLGGVDRDDVEHAIADQANLTATDLDDDDDVQRRRLCEALAEAAAQVDDRHDRTTQVEDTANIVGLLGQVSDVRPALDLPHRHDVDAVLVAADGKADELGARRRCARSVGSVALCAGDAGGDNGF